MFVSLSAKQLKWAVGFLCWSLAVPVLADQLVFGSFRGAVNATNFANKLNNLFSHEISVVEHERDGITWFRVVSAPLNPQELTRVARQADTQGLRYWRLPQIIADAQVKAVDPQPATVRRPPQLGGARLTQPGVMAPVPDAPVKEDRRQLPSREPVQEGGRAPSEEIKSQVMNTGGTKPPPEIDNSTTVSSVRWDLGFQGRGFADRGIFGQDRYTGSLSLQAEFFRGWDGDQQSLVFSPFVRLDSADDDRTHGDIRELYYSFVGDNWDVHLGAKRVFWGVTEFQHLVDVINQTDLVENIDGEDKLGQPMVQLTLIRDWGILDFYALLGFRERTFPGEDGRLRFFLPVSDSADYESGAAEQRVDAALRWSHTLGPVEVGIHHFSGTSREPMLIPGLDNAGVMELRPFYPVIDQTGIDAQAFVGDWAFKLEGFSRSGFGDRYAAFNVGFERTFVGVFNSRADLGLIAEYMFDERGEDAPNTLFEQDIALGGRLQMNDFGDTQALLGVIYDTDSRDTIISLEATRRLTDSWLFSLEGRVFTGDDALHADDPLNVVFSPQRKTAFLQQDDYVQIELTKFF